MGVQNTKGHLADNGGLRGHSVGDTFPYIVVGVGNPFTHLRWKVRRPDGQFFWKTFARAKDAEDFARGIKNNLIAAITENEMDAALLAASVRI